MWNWIRGRVEFLCGYGFGLGCVDEFKGSLTDVVMELWSQ